MHIIIMGCGRVGSTLARGLERRGHTVSVIDQNAESFRRLGSEFGGHTYKGIGFDRDVLIRAGIRDADGFAAVASGDNSNILAARVAREEFGVQNVVARIYDQGRAEVYEKLGIPTVATIRWAAGQVMNRLLGDAATPVWRDPSGTTALYQMPFAAEWVGTPIETIEHRLHLRIPFLTRLGTGMVPSGELLVQEGDVLYAAVPTERAASAYEAMSNPPEQD
ncbi:Regulator of K+ conductance, C-terminal [Propionibacterium ruminifibrarum]|uniref:Regulator of K+ conductance, C-terminal n=2 Tax=Propionibacterium ruminifibrarum TaxID=1962131 RepID=A0A375I1U0_9ACTN|nr:Regulator of K+ conductance, C-terminal [Propionibacterium ruminifibrarum]